MIKKIYLLEIDWDWGMRGARRKSQWYFLKKMTKKQTIKFIKDTYIFDKEMLEDDEDLLTLIEWKTLIISHEYTIIDGENYD